MFNFKSDRCSKLGVCKHIKMKVNISHYPQIQRQLSVVIVFLSSLVFIHWLVGLNLGWEGLIIFHNIWHFSIFGGWLSLLNFVIYLFSFIPHPFPQQATKFYLICIFLFVCVLTKCEFLFCIGVFLIYVNGIVSILFLYIFHWMLFLKCCSVYI